MATIKVRYFTKRVGKRGNVRYFWEPGGALRQKGWRTRRLPDNELDAITEAEIINAGLDMSRRSHQPTEGISINSQQQKYTPGGIYIIASPNGPVKIGVTTNPMRRLAHLQQSTPNKLDLLFYMKCREIHATTAERVVHYLLSAKRLKGEWFAVTPEHAIAAIFRVLGWHPPKVKMFREAMHVDRPD